jgi:O-antigen/teichoic acid export membrane protein
MRRLIEGVTQLSLGLAQPIITNLGLIIGELAGRLINTLQVFGAPKRSSNFRVRSIKRVRFLIKRYKDFPKINLPSNLMNTLCLLLPIIIVNSKFGDEITGYFDLTRVVLTVPFALISVSTSQVLFQKTSEAINKKTGFKSTFKVIIIPLLILSVLSIITITFFAIPIFELFFGPQWNLSAEISKILIFSASVRLVVSPLSITLLSLEKIKTMTLWQTSYFIMITSLFFLPFKNIISFIKVYMIIQLTAYLVYFLLILFEVNKYHTKLKLNMNA